MAAKSAALEAKSEELRNLGREVELARQAAADIVTLSQSEASAAQASSEVAARARVDELNATVEAMRRAALKRSVQLQQEHSSDLAKWGEVD